MVVISPMVFRETLWQRFEGMRTDENVTTASKPRLVLQGLNIGCEKIGVFGISQLDYARIKIKVVKN